MDEAETYSARSKKPVHNSNSLASKLVAGVLLAVIIGVGGFVAGIAYQKGRLPAAATTANTQAGFRSGQGGFSRNGSFGSVTAISATSITVQDRRGNTSKTYSISSATTITNDGAAATYSDIAVGDSVIVTASSSTSTVASRIAVNPSMGSGFGGQQSDPQSGSGTTDSAVTN